MKDWPILFKPELVREIIPGTKTKTRRTNAKKWGKVKRGDRLWVREPFYESGHCFQTYPEDDEYKGWSGSRDVFYVADGVPSVRGKNDWCVEPGHYPDRKFIPDRGNNWWRKRVSIHMPQWACRLFLEATADARVELLQDITEEEAKEEGVEPCAWKPGGIAKIYRAGFAKKWDEINGKGAWGSNPTIAVIAFKLIEHKGFFKSS